MASSSHYSAHPSHPSTSQRRSPLQSQSPGRAQSSYNTPRQVPPPALPPTPNMALPSLPPTHHGAHPPPPPSHPSHPQPSRAHSSSALTSTPMLQQAGVPLAHQPVPPPHHPQSTPPHHPASNQMAPSPYGAPLPPAASSSATASHKHPSPFLPSRSHVSSSSSPSRSSHRSQRPESGVDMSDMGDPRSRPTLARPEDQ